ncbi:hypothetical protein BDV12DRAFT_204261 [Aspergillus spectabilis]
MDYQRCADLHNEILRKGYIGSGKTWPPPKTWWEKEAPPQEVTSKLSTSLIEFLKRVYLPTKSVSPHSIFYYLSYVPSTQDMISNNIFQGAVGGPFNLQTSTAIFVANYLDFDGIANYSQSWMPLEAILAGYINMIDEGKVIAISNCNDGEPGVPDWPLAAPPWILHIYTATDVQKAVAGMKRLLDAIEAKIEESTTSETKPSSTPAEYAYLPWNDPAALPADLVPPRTFAFEFLQAIKRFRVRFCYVAPGVRFPTVEEFLAQKAETPPWQDPGQHSLRILQVDWPEDNDDKDDQDLEITDRKYPGVYIEQVIPSSDFHFSNECRLELPFGIGANGWARQSSGQPLGYDIDAWSPAPADCTWDLYQSGDPTGFTGTRLVQIHKVLENWAERVERGDWEVNKKGVIGGSRKFREADTEEGWEKYWIPLSW